MYNILVCDDEKDIVSALHIYLSAEGYRVLTAFDGPEALRLLDFFHAEGAVLKERSPSCGKGVIYDGSFSGALTEGDGVFAQLLRERGVPVYGESDIPDLLGKA